MLKPHSVALLVVIPAERPDVRIRVVPARASGGDVIRIRREELPPRHAGQAGKRPDDREELGILDPPWLREGHFFFASWRSSFLMISSTSFAFFGQTTGPVGTAVGLVFRGFLTPYDVPLAIRPRRC